MLNIVIPMAGAGSRFSIAGYEDPKPLIKIHDMPMINLVIRNLAPDQVHRFIFICQNKHIKQYDLTNKLTKWSLNSIVIGIDGLTEGAACTVLFAKNYINTDDELMIANSDQFVDVSIDQYLLEFKSKDLDGMIMTMTANDPKWSFVEVHNNYVTRVVEKEVISNEATVGIYNFRHGKDFVSAAENMIKNQEKVNNEYYVAPVYNKLIKNNKKIGIYNIGSEANGMYGLGIPKDLDLFLSLPVSKKAVVK